MFQSSEGCFGDVLGGGHALGCEEGCDEIGFNDISEQTEKKSEKKEGKSNTKAETKAKLPVWFYFGIRQLAV